MSKYVTHFQYVLFIAWLVLSASVSAADQKQVGALSDQLRVIIEERLDLMPSVARYKFEKNLPVEDLPREAQILDNAVKQAEKLGFDPAMAQQALVAQMSAAKLLQTKLIAAWRLNPEASRNTPHRDLATVIRPAISGLNKQLLTTLDQVQDIDRCIVAENLKDPGSNFPFDPAIWHLAIGFLAPDQSDCD